MSKVIWQNGTYIPELKTKPSLTFQKVILRPEKGIPNVIYLVPSKKAGDNLYEEWLYLDDSWELLGDVKVDLTPLDNKIKILEENIKTLENTIKQLESKVKESNNNTLTVLNNLDKKVTTNEAEIKKNAEVTARAVLEVKNSIPTSLSQLSDDAEHRLTTDVEKEEINLKIKENALEIKENAEVTAAALVELNKGGTV